MLLAKKNVQLLEEKTKREEKEIDIQIKDQTFKLLNVKIEDASIDGNKLFLYANFLFFPLSSV